MAAVLISSPLLGWLRLHFLRAEAHVVRRHADDPGNHREVADPLQRTLPDPHHPRHVRILGQPAVALRMVDVVQHVHDVRAADAGRIVDARVFVRSVLAKLRGARLGQILHVVLGAEVQTAGGAGLDAGRLQARAHAIRAQRTLVDLLGFELNFGMLNGQPVTQYWQPMQ